MYQSFVINLAGGYRKENLEGRPHLVVNGAILADKVISGSEGAFRYPRDENEKSVPLWNGQPIVVNHPKKGNKFVSAKSKEVFNTRKIGVLLNSAHDDKLRTEFWFDEQRTKEVDRRIYDNILANKSMEVSTGLDGEIEESPGEFEGVKYKGVVRNYKPDHVAILPDSIGAYSIAMGGGLFANAAQEPERTQLILSKTLNAALKTIGAEMTVNELSFSSISKSLSDLLSSAYGKPGRYWDGYVVQVYTNFVIFRDEEILFAVGYTVQDDNVSLNGKAIEVKQVLTYQTKDGKSLIGNESGELNYLEEKEKDMAFDKKAHLASLIGNGYKETDREWLEKMPDDTLAKILPASVAKETPGQPPILATPTPTPLVNTTIPAPVPAPQMTEEEWLKNAPPSIRRTFQNAMEREKAEKEVLVKKITNSPNNSFTEEWLRAQDPATLLGMANLLPQEQEHHGAPNQFLPGFGGPNYGGAIGVPPMINNQQNAPQILDEEAPQTVDWSFDRKY